MPSAEIIAIGTEILLGEIVDTNSQFLAKALRDAGIDVFRTSTIGDNSNRIAQVVKESLTRCDIVITTGGLGPTVDDPTRDAIASALGVRSVFRADLWEQIKSRFHQLGRIPTDNNKRQAYIPDGAVAIENPVGTAPIFIIELASNIVISLPGVPSEMKYLAHNKIIPYLRNYYRLTTIIKNRTLHTVGVGESQIDDLIGELEQLRNPTVGLAAHSGQVDVRITAKAESEEEANDLIQPVEIAIRKKLGEWIYGMDQDTLEEIALHSIEANHWTLAVLESGLGGYLVRRLALTSGPFAGGQVLTGIQNLEQLTELTASYCVLRSAGVGLGVAVHRSDNIFEIEQILITPDKTGHYSRRYGGAPDYVPVWAFNQSMDLIRRIPHGN